jgi:hypothetical protein
MRLHATSSTTGDKKARRHSVTGAETGLGDAAGRSPLLGRRHSASDVLAEQSDFADDNRDPNKVVLNQTKLHRPSLSPTLKTPTS